MNMNTKNLRDQLALWMPTVATASASHVIPAHTVASFLAAAAAAEVPDDLIDAVMALPVDWPAYNAAMAAGLDPDTEAEAHVLAALRAALPPGLEVTDAQLDAVDATLLRLACATAEPGPRDAEAYGGRDDLAAAVEADTFDAIDTALELLPIDWHACRAAMDRAVAAGLVGDLHCTACPRVANYALPGHFFGASYAAEIRTAARRRTELEALAPAVDHVAERMAEVLATAETPDELRAVLGSIPLDWAAYNSAVDANPYQPGQSVSDYNRTVISAGLPAEIAESEGAVYLIACAVTRMTRGMAPPEDDTVFTTRDELAAAVATNNPDTIDAALAGLPVYWPGCRDGLVKADEDGLAPMEHLIGVVASYARPGYFVGASLAQEIIEAVELAAGLRFDADNAAHTAALAADPETLDKYIAACAAAETLDDLDAARINLLPMDWRALHTAAVAADLPEDAPIEDIMEARRRVIRAGLHAVPVVTDAQLEAIACAIDRTNRGNDDPEDDTVFTTRADLAAAVATGDREVIDEALVRLPIFWTDHGDALRSFGRDNIPTTASFLGVIYNNARHGYFIGAAWAAEIHAAASHRAMPPDAKVDAAMSHARAMLDQHGKDDPRTHAAMIDALELQDPGCCARMAAACGIDMTPTHCTEDGKPLYSLDAIAGRLGSTTEELTARLGEMQELGVGVATVSAEEANTLQ